MATRALIGFIQGEAAGNVVLTSTYNHYDGYPDNLGKGLKTFYNTTEKAKEIANQGYISYLDPETGEIEAKHQEPADKTVLPDDDFMEAMLEVASVADSYGAEYIYLWNFHNDEWVVAPLNKGTRAAANELVKVWHSGKDVFGPPLDEVEESYETKWKNFLEEGSDNYKQGVARGRIGANLTAAMTKLQDEPKEMLDAYRDSLQNDIRLNGPMAYDDYSAEDFIEDYENYVADKMDI